MHAIDKQIQTLGLTIPPPPPPAGSYLPVIFSGSLAYVSGQLSRSAEGHLVTGIAGQDLSLAEAQQAARCAALQAVSLLRAYVGWDRFVRIIRLAGYVQAAPHFKEISQVMNGASDVLKDLFGEAGLGVRTAVGAASLPLNAAVEVELTVEWKG